MSGPRRSSILAGGWHGVAGLAIATLGCSSSATGGKSPAAEPQQRAAPGSSASAVPRADVPTPDGSDWVSSPQPNLRALTVLVRTSPPAALQAKFRQLAARYKPLQSFFEASAEEGFGSGFVMVRREGGQSGKPSRRLPFVVTNRHVVGLSSLVRVALGADGPSIEARVAYVDERYDLAVLAITAEGDSEGASRWAKVASGLALSTTPARDQDVVVASGYPGIGDRPSYQVTRGFVSNEHFVLDDAGSEQLYVQHTAPIDPGSSGGPLTTPEGKLLGVNTLKIRGRENVGLAVPSSVVERALAEVARRVQSPEPGPALAQALAACRELLESASQAEAGLLEVELALGAALVAEHGVASLASLPAEDEWPGRFLEDPTGVFLHAIALRLKQATAKDAGAECVPTPAAGDGGFAFKVRLGGAERVLTFGSEQGRFKLVGGVLGRSGGRSFLDQLDSRRAPPKKWKPSMR